MAISISKATIVTQIDTGLPVPEEDTTIGNYTQPSAETASSDTSAIIQVADNNRESLTGAGWNGSIHATQLSGLTEGTTITHVRLRVNTSAGNVRVKLYTDDGAGNPSALVAESGSIAVGGTGYRDYALTASYDVGADGILWAGFECDSASLSLYYEAGAAAERRLDTHTYGAGDDPFVEASNHVNTPYFALMDGSLTAHVEANAIDDNTTNRWQSLQETNPNIYIDCNGVGNLNLIGCAFMPSDSNTETNFLIQTSTDASTWTTVGTVTTLTADVWIFVRFNMQVARYIRIYGNSGSSLVMSLKEIKYKADAGFPSDHIHNTISATTANAGVSTA